MIINPTSVSNLLYIIVFPGIEEAPVYDHYTFSVKKEFGK